VIKGSNAFKHLDPSATKIYQSIVLYGFEADEVCLLLKVKNGYVVETPLYHRNKTEWSWIRGQHIETLKPFFLNIMALRMCST
jgi:hypothetical protein